MRLGPKIISATAMLLAAVGSWTAATVAANIIEERSGMAVGIRLIEAGHDWADVYTDGLQVHIGGMSPSEAQRFNALHVAGTVVDATRIVDGTTVQPSKPLTPPSYSIEILRNDEGVTLIGLVPRTLDRAGMVDEIRDLAEGSDVTDLLESAQYPAPDGWDAAVRYGMNALSRLPRSKISISSGLLEITAIAESEAEKRSMEQELEKILRRRANLPIDIRYNISAPRPVITPFTLRFVIDENGARFDACSADTLSSQGRILAAAARAGRTERGNCTLGLGVPTTEWADAVIQGIDAVAELGGGSVSFSDADVTLVAMETTPQADFDRVVGALESNLPEVFSLHSVLPRPAEVDTDADAFVPPEFVATRSPEGQVQLRGRLNNPLVRDTVQSFATARYGSESVYMAARIDEQLPDGWPVRVLAGLQALAELDSGAVTIREDFVSLSGKTGNRDAQAEIARILGEKLGDSQRYELNVVYVEALDPLAALPTPEECVDDVNALVAETKINFEPGSSDISGDAIGVVNGIAEILKACHDVDMEIEIAGHTDSQGREEMNLDLSQSRAESVLDALTARRVLTSKIIAKGYGEAEPIADNDTEEGREANRRIEFRLLTAAATQEDDSDAPAADDTAEEDGAGDDAEGTEQASQTEGASEELDATSGAAEEPDTEQDNTDGTEESQ